MEVGWSYRRSYRCCIAALCDFTKCSFPELCVLAHNFYKDEKCDWLEEERVDSHVIDTLEKPC